MSIHLLRLESNINNLYLRFRNKFSVNIFIWYLLKIVTDNIYTFNKSPLLKEIHEWPLSLNAPENMYTQQNIYILSVALLAS